MHSNPGLYIVIAFLVFIAALLVMRVLYWPAFLWGKKKNISYDTSLLLAMYSEMAKLNKLASGEVDGTPYSVMEVISTLPERDPSNSINAQPTAYIYIFELGFHTEAHILGFGKSINAESIADKLQMMSYNVEKVSLEGDFDSYFSVYCAPEQQIKTRTIFSPDNMEIFADYVKNYSWEVIGNRLYVVGGLSLSVTEGVIKDTNDFIKDIRPIISETPKVITTSTV
jgi:hypothetical protein